jgi:nicotinate-nucleotide pyrophosphorylase (carboxylating)
LEKYAVCVGGGHNHRFGLDDGILIKDNHIAAAGGIVAAIAAARNRAPHTLKIEVEVVNLEQLEEAMCAGADIVLLDNMASDEMRKAVERANGRVLLEASGGVDLDTVKDIAEAGVDIISVGALTHSAPALDISLNIEGHGS